jgi:hypothetical protein
MMSWAGLVSGSDGSGVATVQGRDHPAQAVGHDDLQHPHMAEFAYHVAEVVYVDRIGDRRHHCTCDDPVSHASGACTLALLSHYGLSIGDGPRGESRLHQGALTTVHVARARHKTIGRQFLSRFEERTTNDRRRAGAASQRLRSHASGSRTSRSR